MSWEDEIVLRDVTNAGIVVSDRIGREAGSQFDLEETLEAARYASHPYSTHPREVTRKFSHKVSNLLRRIIIWLMSVLSFICIKQFLGERAQFGTLA